MKLKTKLKLKIFGNLLSGIGCSIGVAYYNYLPTQLFFGLLAIIAFAMAAHDFDRYPVED